MAYKNEKNLLNPFLVIKRDYKLGIILTDYFNKKNYKLNSKDFSHFFNISDKVNEERTLKTDKDLQLFKEFKKIHFFINPKNEIQKIYERAKFWIDFQNFESLFYHIFAYNYPFLDYRDKNSMEIDSMMMENYKHKDEHPSFYKVYSTSKIRLVKPESYPKVNAVDIFNGFTLESKKLDLELFSMFVFSSFGKTNPQVEYVRKTVPSGGGKHPTEIYFVIPDGLFIKSGVYHYNLLDNSLDIIKEGNFWKEFVYATNLSLDIAKEVKFGVIYTGLVERAMWRYRDLRSTRAIQADIGHIIQNSQWNGKALGIDSQIEYNLKESELSKLLDLKDNNEVIFAANTFYLN